MEEEVSNNGGPWRARMNSRAPRQKEKKKKTISTIITVVVLVVFPLLHYFTAVYIYIHCII